MSNLSTYYSFNQPDVNFNGQVVNWATGSPLYDASLTSGLYISSQNYKTGNGSLEIPKNLLGTYTTSTLTSFKTLKTVSLAVSLNNLKMVLSTVDSELYFCTRNSESENWNTRTLIQSPNTASPIGNTSSFYRISLTGDGSRFVTNTIYLIDSDTINGYIFYSDWNANSSKYNYITKIDANYRRDYRSVVITNDGNRIIACTKTNIYLSTLVDGSYSIFNKTLEIDNSGYNYLGITVSSNGDRIVYGDSTNKKWFLAFWNGTTYTAGKNIITGTITTRNCSFNNDASLLFISYSSGSIIYVYSYDNVNNTYTALTSKNINITGLGDTHILYCVSRDTSYNIHIYSGVYDSTSIYLTKYPISSNGVYCLIRPPIIDTGGLTIACWFRSNYNLNNAPIFDFSTANTATSDNIRLFINNNALTFSIYKTSTNNLFNITGNINDNSWNHIAITMSYSSVTTSTVIAYINGSNGANTFPNKPYPTITTRDYSFLGRSNSTSGDQQFFGNIDDFRVYNSVLTDSEILTLYNNTNVKNNYTNSTVHRLYHTAAESTSQITPTPTNVGSSKTYYYWNDPYAITNTIINKSNPYNFYYTYDNTSQYQNAKVSIITNELVTLKLNGVIQTNILNSGNTFASPQQVPLAIGNNLFEFITYNNGGPAYFAAYVTNSNNAYLFSTKSDMGGWKVKITGLYSNGYPVSSLLVNDSTSTPYTTASEITTATNYRTLNLDLSSNKSCKRIKQLNLNFISNNNDLANILFSYP